MSQRLVVKITHGVDDPERAHLACNVANVALASGVEVHAFLAVEGVRLAQPDVPRTIKVAEAPPIEELIDTLYDAATVTVCTPCATRRGLAEDDFRKGTQMAGSAAFVAAATEEATTTLVY